MQDQQSSPGCGDKMPADKYASSVSVTSQEEAKRLVRDLGLDLVQTNIEEGRERYRLKFFLNQTEIEELRSQKIRVDVGENVSELGLKRQTEVAEGDRFDGGRLAPKGLGVNRVCDGKEGK